LHLPREAFVFPYVLAAGVLTALFVQKERIDLVAAARRNPMRSLLVTAITSAVVLASVFAQPGAPRAHGMRLAFELVWDGVAYGAVDGVLLTVVPISAVRRALAPVRWTSDLLAVVASIAVFVVYHLGFPEFRGPAIGAPIVAGTIFGAAYLASRNPLAPVVAHAAMHIAAVLHGPAGTMQLPPHY
jgi:membrane protease YdiL (CAAX protease family)